MSVATALPARIGKRVGEPDANGCMRWTGSHQTQGYGMVWWLGRMRQAHRVIYELLVGPIADGLEPDHLCQQKDCVNPDHLEPVTHAENMRRAECNVRRRTQTHCYRGHEFTPENTYVNAGRRTCRACRRINQRKR